MIDEVEEKTFGQVSQFIVLKKTELNSNQKAFIHEVRLMEQYFTRFQIVVSVGQKKIQNRISG